MAIFLDENTKVIVQGMTGSEGTKHTRRMIASGTKIVGGVTPGKGGQVVEIEGKSLPVFNSVSEAVAATGANASVKEYQYMTPPASGRMRNRLGNQELLARTVQD
jgi:succinyl-CoA synthetase alpha subunit